jgi:hypothetical protein
MKLMRNALLFTGLVLLGLGTSCSKKEEVKPTTDLLIYIRSTARIEQFVEVEFNGRVVGRLTNTRRNAPTCDESPSSSLLIVPGIEMGIEHRIKFVFVDRSVLEDKFIAPTTLQDNECWTYNLF